jgi:hypothetical protein
MPAGRNKSLFTLSGTPGKAGRWCSIPANGERNNG